MNESTYFNKTMVALESVVGKSKEPFLTIDPTTSLVDIAEAPIKKARADALKEREAELEKPRSPSAIEKYEAKMERKEMAEQ